jgi:hypothetical protein
MTDSPASVMGARPVWYCTVPRIRDPYDRREPRIFDNIPKPPLRILCVVVNVVVQSKTSTTHTVLADRGIQVTDHPTLISLFARWREGPRIYPAP